MVLEVTKTLVIRTLRGVERRLLQTKKPLHWVSKDKISDKERVLFETSVSRPVLQPILSYEERQILHFE